MISRTLTALITALVLLVSAAVVDSYGFDIFTFPSSGLHGQAKSALAVAQRWHSDAFLVQIDIVKIDPKQQRVTFWFRSHSTGEVYTVTDGQGTAAQSNLGGKPIEPGFIDYPAAVKVAQDAGMKGDSNGGVLSYQNLNGKGQLAWEINGNWPVDAMTGKSLTQMPSDAEVAKDYNNLVDQARKGLQNLTNAPYQRWRTCAKHVYEGSYTLPSSASAWARMLYPQNNPGITIPGPVAEFQYGYYAPGTSESFTLLVPMRQLLPNEPGKARWMHIDEPPNVAYVIASGMTNQSLAAQWGNDLPRLQAELRDAYNGACHVTH